MIEHDYQGLSQSGFHRIHYTEWGESNNPNVLICVHGLTRSGRDFDFLAQQLSTHYRVICPDVVGRGQSSWLTNKADYNTPQYLADMNALIAKCGATEVHWLGTSMGGIIGMILAAMPNSPITKLVLNDVGSRIPKAALDRIGQYIGKSPEFDSLDALIAAVIATSPFGPLSDTQWHNLTLPLVKQTDNKKWRFRYDPGIAQVYEKGIAADVDLSIYWNAVQCPVLITRGADSDLLLPSTYAAMCAKDKVSGVEFAHVGHAPMFQTLDQTQPVAEFLAGKQACLVH